MSTFSGSPKKSLFSPLFRGKKKDFTGIIQKVYNEGLVAPTEGEEGKSRHNQAVFPLKKTNPPQSFGTGVYFEE